MLGFNKKETIGKEKRIKKRITRRDLKEKLFTRKKYSSRLQDSSSREFNEKKL